LFLQQVVDFKHKKYYLFFLLLSIACTKPPEYLENDLVLTAKSCLGVHYRYGGKEKSGFDCSGLVYFCYRSIGIKLPPSTKLLRKKGHKVSGSLKLNKFIKGDLLFFRIGKIFGKSNHVGIYIGNGMMIHASSTKGVVKESLKKEYWKDKFTFSRRIIK